MALNKDIKLANGVTCSYHRIALINVNVNQQIIILVRSYTDPEGRELEKGGAEIPPYTHEECYIIDYDNLGALGEDAVKGAYELLKQLPEFEEAEDI
jgi:hypothetical protein